MAAGHHVVWDKLVIFFNLTSVSSSSKLAPDAVNPPAHLPLPLLALASHLSTPLTSLLAALRWISSRKGRPWHRRNVIHWFFVCSVPLSSEQYIPCSLAMLLPVRFYITLFQYSVVSLEVTSQVWQHQCNPSMFEVWSSILPPSANKSLWAMSDRANLNVCFPLQTYIDWYQQNAKEQIRPTLMSEPVGNFVSNNTQPLKAKILNQNLTNETYLCRCFCKPAHALPLKWWDSKAGLLAPKPMMSK